MRRSIGARRCALGENLIVCFQQSKMEMTTVKTVVVMSIIFGCFAVLYPKIFHPMLTHLFGASNSQDVEDDIGRFCFKLIILGPMFHLKFFCPANFYCNIDLLINNL